MATPSRLSHVEDRLLCLQPAPLNSTEPGESRGDNPRKKTNMLVSQIMMKMNCYEDRDNSVNETYDSVPLGMDLQGQHLGPGRNQATARMKSSVFKSPTLTY